MDNNLIFSKYFDQFLMYYIIKHYVVTYGEKPTEEFLAMCLECIKKEENKN